MICDISERKRRRGRYSNRCLCSADKRPLLPVQVATRLEEMRRGCEEDLADARLARGEHRALVPELEAAELEHGIMCQYLFAADPAFRSAFASCADWLSRAALAQGHAGPGAHQAPRSRWSGGPGRAPGASTTAVFGPFKTSAQTEGIGE